MKKEEKGKGIRRSGLHKVIRIFMYILFAVTLLAGGISVAEIRTESYAHVDPDYQPVDLLPVLDKEVYSEDDYRTIYLQTGLGRPAVDDLREGEDYIKRMLSFQKNFFAPVNYVCYRFNILTSQEYLVDEYGRYTNAYELAPLEDGDILITKSSHSLGYRNGHVGIVVDAKEGITVEAICLGEPTVYERAASWLQFPDLIVLRLKEDPDHNAEKIAEDTKKYLVGVPYRLTAGIFGKKYKDPAQITGTQCAHLIWEAYRMYGYDIDSDGGKIVTVKDICDSPLFEIVQIYGVDPEHIW